MALEDDVQTRVASGLLIQLTNGYDTTATTINAARLALAARDVEATFRTHAQVVYDNTNARHLALGVQGVLVVLEEWLGLPEATPKRERWESALEKFSRTEGGRGWAVPRSTSGLTATREPAGLTNRPDFDQSVFDELVPRPPRGATTRHS